MQRSFSFIFFFFVMLRHFRYYSLYSARLVASLLRESLYKRQMIHIHVRSTGATRVKTWCWCEKNKTEIWPKRKRVSLWYGMSVLLSQVATWDHKMSWCEKATTPIWITGKYEHWSNTHTHTHTHKNNFHQIKVFVLQKAFFCFVLRITLRKSCVPLTFRQTRRSSPASEVTMEE